MSTMPFKVEIDWTMTNTWVDVSTKVRAVQVKRGRSREVDQVNPGTATFTFENIAGDFTPGLTTGANYPNVVQNRPIRVSVNPSGTPRYLFTGVVDKWGHSWDFQGRFPLAVANCTDGFKGLARRTAVNLYSETLFSSTFPTLEGFYQLSEQSGSLQFFNTQPLAPQPPAALVTSKYGSGTLTAGDQAGYLAGGAPQNTCLTLAPTGSGNTQGMTVVEFAGPQVANGPTPNAAGPWAWSCWFKVAAAPSGSYFLLYSRSAPITDPSVGSAHHSAQLWMSNTGKINFAITSAFGPSVGVTSAASYADGQWHKATASVHSDNKTVDLFVDATTATTVGGTALSLPKLSLFTAGGALSQWNESANGLNGSIAMVELYSAGVTALMHQILWSFGLLGYYVTNDTGAMITDLAQDFGYSQFAYPFIIADTGVTARTAIVDIAGQNYLTAMQVFADTEQGMLYQSGDGNLRFKSRASRVNQTSAFTIDNGNDEIDTDLTFETDDTLLFNDFAATRPGGTVIRVRDTTSTSVADNGLYTNAPQDSGAKLVYVMTDNELTDYCTYKVTQYGQPKPRASIFSIDLMTNPAIWPTIETVELGQKFTAANLPVEAPASSMDFIIESLEWNYDRSSEIQNLKIESSPADLTTYMTLDDNTYGLLDNNSLFY